jgi:hypothetical protein
MLTTREAIERRRSIRKYKPEPVKEEVLTFMRKGATMKKVLSSGLILALLCGCSGTIPCVKYTEAYNTETRTARKVPYPSDCPADSPDKGYNYISLLIATIGSSAAEIQNISVKGQRDFPLPGPVK